MSKTAFIFPGQGAQFENMTATLKDESGKMTPAVADILAQADDILGFSLSDIMTNGSSEELQQTKVTQPAIFTHSIATYVARGEGRHPDGVAGHSLGEFSALVIAQVLSFEDGLRLVSERAQAMQAACEQQESTMAAIIGLEDEQVEQACAAVTDHVVVPANYNSPGQLVISGDIPGIEAAVAASNELGAKRAIVLPVGGAFHSPLMAPARERLAKKIEQTTFNAPICPIYQNVDALPHNDPEVIKAQLVEQLTSPVRWVQTILNMQADGYDNFVEIGGKGNVLRGLIRKIDRHLSSSSL